MNYPSATAAETRMRFPTLAVLLLFLLSSCTLDTGAGPARVEIVPDAVGYALQVNGNQYFIRGAVGNQNLDALLAAGANSIRRVAVTADDFNRAERLGLTVLAGLEIATPAKGFDYGDGQAVEQQREVVRSKVALYRDEPSLLMWALGSESASMTSAEQRVPMWEGIEDLARIVKQEDPNHPVITVISGTDIGTLGEIREHCPSLDAVGIDAAELTPALPELISDQGWDGAYIVTQLGPPAEWSVGTTQWGAPVQPDSSARAGLYLESYERAVAGQPNCLGSYAALWADDQEPLRSWQGFFLTDGNPTGVLDAMTYVWSRAWPVNRAPQIGSGGITISLEDGEPRQGDYVFPPGSTLHCAVDVSDLEGDPLIVNWELVADVGDRSAESGVPRVIENAVVANQMYRAVVRLPDETGAYRLFAYIRDSKGSTAVANVPIDGGAGF